MKHISTLILFIILILNCQSQSNLKLDTALAKNFRLNFAVPESPAFKALNTDVSNILRPSGSELISFMTSQFINNEKLVLPKSLALEISPLYLSDINKLSLSDYQSNKILYSSKFSLATRMDSLQRTEVSIGIRISPIDKGDLKTDNAALDQIFNILSERTKAKTKIIDDYLIENNISEERFGNDLTLKKAITEYAEAKLAIQNLSLEQINSRIQKIKDDYKKDNWNAEKFDIAFAITALSEDSLAENVAYQSFTFWSTYSFPLTKKNSQILFGLNLHSDKDGEVIRNDFSFATRAYVGANRLKGFAEFQYKSSELENKNILFINSGIELNPRNGFWFNLAFGLENNATNSESRFVPNFKLSYNLPENFNIF